MTQFLTLVVTGLVTGAIYSLIATCLTLSYRTTGIFNLGYGGVAFTAAFMYYLLHVGVGWPIIPSALVTFIVTGPVTGWALDRLIFRRLTDASDAAKVMATVGVLVFLPALAYLVEQIINDLGASLPDTTQVASTPGIGPTPVDTWHIWGIPLDSDQLIVFVAAALVAVAMSVLLRRTRLGLQMRALVDRPALAEVRGINRQRTSMLAWVIGCSLASLTGMVAAPAFQSLSPGTYNTITFVSIAAAVVAAFRNIPLAFASGLALGVLEAVVARYATFASGIQGFNSAVPFVVILVGIMIWGRNRTRVAGTAADAVVQVDHTADLSRLRRMLPWLVATVALVIYILFVADSFWLAQSTEGLALALVFLSFTVITGLGGLVSLAQAAFAMVSALTVGLLITQYGVPYPAAVLAGIAVAAVLGLLISVPALRLGGLALAIATLALGFLGDNALFQWHWLVNGLDGWILTPPKYGPVDLSNPRTLAFTILILIGLVILIVRNLERSATGRAAVAMNASDPAARMSGISPAAVKLFVVTVGAAIAGLGGAMLFTYSTAITGSTYPTSVGLVWFAGVVLWGIRRPGSAVLAGLTVAVVPALISGGFHVGWFGWNGTVNPYIPDVLFGLGAIQMAKDPDGLLSFNAGLLRTRRARRAKRLAARTSPEAQQPMKAADGEPLRPNPAAAHESARVTIERVFAGYGQVEVLKDVSLSFPAATITAVIGVNGAGKSTLCGVLSGTVEPTSGGVFLEREDIGRLPPHSRCRRGLMVAPESRGVFPSLTVDDNLALLLPRVTDREAAYDRFPLLANRRSQPAGNLSGGEQQTLTMAPLLVNPPKFLVADEPTLGLAPTTAAQLLQLCCELREKGVTLLLVEEKAAAVLEIADQVAVLELGRVVWSGPPSALRREELYAHYMGALAGTAPAPDPAAAVVADRASYDLPARGDG